MKKHLRRYAVGALAIGAVAGGAAVALPSTVVAAAAEWSPVAFGLDATPASLLPSTVTTAEPVRVVSTSLDAAGRPVVTVHTATDKTTAEAYVKAGQTASNAVGVQLDSVITVAGAPTGTDPSRAQQWDFAKIRVADAWQKSTGAGVTVAVIDTGVDASHPDLAGNVLPGLDLVTDTTGVSTDPNGHGTHVAGTIAAVTGNGVGISAIAPDTKILPIRVLDAKGAGWTSDSATAIIYAADHGAAVINMSISGTVRDGAVSNAITYARSKGVVVVAAAGNLREKGSPVSYPGADAGVIGVAATDSADNVAYYSNAGSYVDVAAPGSGILSTVPNNGYSYYNGTSMATPHVAAVAALVKAANPALTPDQVQAAIEKSAVDLGKAGKDTDYGYGRIDALAAVTAAAPVTATPTPSKTTASPTPTVTKTASPTPTKTATPTPTVTKTPTPTPTKVVPKVRPAIRVVPATTSLVYGSPATITYTVTVSGKPWALQPVRIAVTPVGGTIAYTDATTDAAGIVKFAQPATGRMQVKLVAAGTDTTLEATSMAVSFAVKAQIAVSSPAAGTLKVVLTGAAGQTVQVQRYEKSRWVLATSYTATTADFTLSQLTTGTQYRVIVPTTTAITGVTSGIIKIS